MMYFATACAGVLLAGCASGPSYNGPRPGDTCYVSTEKLEVSEKPDGLSNASAELKYSDQVKVKDVYRVAPPFNGDRKNFPESLLPCWLEVLSSTGDGYVPAGALVSEWLINNQNPAERISADGMTAAKRGFSESEDDADMASMRGAAGAGNFMKEADFDAVDKLFVEQRKHMVGRKDILKFVSEGGLKQNEIQSEHLDLTERSAASRFMTGSRQFIASGLGKITGNTEDSNDKSGELVSAVGKAGAGMVYSESGPVQEFQMGEAVAAKVLPAYHPISMDDPRAVYLSKVANTLAAASNDPMPYRGLLVVLADSKEVNAFAVPGGFLIVTTAMLDFLQDEDELAAIIGHEIGHLELKHGMKAVGTEKILKLFSLLKEIGEPKANGGPEDVLVSQLNGMIDDVFNKMFASVRNGYGVETESQADWRSLQLCNRLGYDTMALYDVLERFKTVKGTYGGAGYPAERGSDILKYREQFGYADGVAAGRDVRTQRYKAAVKH